MSLVPENQSGEVTVLDPVDFLQFAGLAGVARGVSSVISKTAVGSFRQLFGSGATQVERTALKPSILDPLKQLFAKPTTKVLTGVGAGGAAVASTITPVAKSGISTGTKALLGIGGLTAITGLTTLTPTGQQIVTTGGDIGKGLTDIGKNLTSNPIILIALIGLGALVILKK